MTRQRVSSGELRWGGGEQSLQRMPSRDLLCVMRIRMAGNTLRTRPLTKVTHSLAAARFSDNGYTWSRPEAIAPFGVTPHLRTLDNGTVAVVYGRPSVHVRVSADSGKTWSEAFPLVGPTESQLMAEAGEEGMPLSHTPHSSAQSRVISLSNTDVVVTGPDRFVVSYSDFQYRDGEDRQRKAIKVTRMIVETPATDHSVREFASNPTVPLCHGFRHRFWRASARTSERSARAKTRSRGRCPGRCP